MALTTTATLTQELFDAIKAEMLITTDNNFTFLQHAVPLEGEVEAGAKTINFNQPDLPTGTYSETSRRMTEGTAVSALHKAITATQKTLTVREYAGPYSNADTAVVPFGITERLKKMAKHDLAAWLGSFLRRDRNKFINQVRMDDLLTATTVVTPNAAAEGAITAGQAASATWLSRLNKAMKDALIPTFANGRWKLVINTRQEQELKADADIKAAFREFAQANPLLQGQLGVYEGFDIFVDTLIPVKMVGAGSAVTGYQAVAFGPYHLGHGTVMDAEPRRADDTDFGRQERIIWLSIEAFGLLYPAFVIRCITT